jgi:hypothetical protein
LGFTESGGSTFVGILLVGVNLTSLVTVNLAVIKVLDLALVKDGRSVLHTTHVGIIEE